MLGLKRMQIFTHQLPSSAANMSYSDTESESEMSVYTEIPGTYPDGFVALIIKGNNAVKQFEQDFPTHYSRCLLAKRIDRGYIFPDAVPYEITLHEYSSWRVGAGIESFMRELIPESARAHCGVYNVSDWDTFDYLSERDTAKSTSSSPQSVKSWTYDEEHPTTPPAKNRHPSALETINRSGFGAHSDPLKALLHKSPWQRMSSQQCSPEQKSQARSLSNIPAPPTLQLASNSADAAMQ